MFNMFNGGKPDPMTLWVVDQEERRNDLDRVVRYLRANYSRGTCVDADEIADELNIARLSPEEIEYIESRLR